jgi:hypothetical protein
VDEARLREVAFAVADAVGLSIFGGDVVVASPDDPVLIDLNDWPSFAPFRDAAADHIAEYALHCVEEPRRALMARHAASRTRSSTSQHANPQSSFAPDPA